MLKTITLRDQDSEATLSLFGAQLLTWTKAGKEILFNNPLTITDGSKALRTGAPICFPWFNKGVSFAPELKPSHGTARISDWNIFSQSESICSFVYETNSYLNLPLSLSVTYFLQRNSLKVDFKVKNLSDVDNQFELALHTYFATSAPQATKIYGICPSSECLVPQIPIDQIFKNLNNPVKAEMSDNAIEINNHNFDKTVVWHPGLKHGIKDLEDSEELAAFICVESLTDVISLEALVSWDSSVHYTLQS